MSHSYCILQPYIVHGQTGLVALEFRAANNFAKNFQKRRGFLSIQMATTTNLNIDTATVRQMFKAVIKASDEINEKSIVHGQAKRVLPIQPLAQASEFYVPNGIIMTVLL